MSILSIRLTERLDALKRGVPLAKPEVSHRWSLRFLADGP